MSEESNQISIHMTPMLFGILEEIDLKEHCNSQKNKAENLSVAKWNNLFEKLKGHCMKFAKAIPYGQAHGQNSNFTVSLVLGNRHF